MSTNQGGAKWDGNKLPVNLFFDGLPRAIKAVTEIMKYGRDKYSTDTYDASGSWLKVPDGINRYTAAMRRHDLNIAEAGNHFVTDDESGLLDAAHRACDALFVLELMLREREAYDKESNGA